MLSNCPQYSFRQADNEHRDSLKENIRNTFCWIQYYCPDKFSPGDRNLAERFPLKLYWEIFNLPRIHFTRLDARDDESSFIKSQKTRSVDSFIIYLRAEQVVCPESSFVLKFISAAFNWQGDTRRTAAGGKCDWYSCFHKINSIGFSCFATIRHVY